MKQLTPLILLLLLTACGRSSPEGRAEMRREMMQKRLDSVINQNRAILDSIHAINKEISNLKSK